MSWIETKREEELRQQDLAAAKAIYDKAKSEARDMNGEEEASWTAALTSADKREARIVAIKAQNEKEGNLRDLVGKDDYQVAGSNDQELARNAWVKSFIRNKPFSLTNNERRALDGAGSAWVPDAFSNKLVEHLLYDAGPLEAGAEFIKTVNGQPLPIYTFDDTANTGNQHTEAADISFVGGDPTDALKTLNAFEFDSGGVALPIALAEDAAFDVEGKLALALATRINKKRNLLMTTGDGTGEPEGVVTGATAGKTTAGVAAVTYNEMLDLFAALNPAYISEKDCVIMCNNATLWTLRKLVDGQGNPLWNAGNVAAGFPSTLGGFRYVINPHMANMGAGNKSILFGNFKRGYVVRQVKDIQVISIPDYLKKLSYGFAAWVRGDGRYQDSNAVKYLVHASS